MKEPGDTAGGGGVPRAGLSFPAGSHPVADIPFAPIVRSLLKYPLGSPEFEDALLCSGPAEREFTREIIRQQKDRLIVRRAELHRRQAEMRAEYPGIDRA